MQPYKLKYGILVLLKCNGQRLLRPKRTEPALTVGRVLEIESANLILLRSGDRKIITNQQRRHFLKLRSPQLTSTKA